MFFRSVSLLYDSRRSQSLRELLLHFANMCGVRIHPCSTIKLVHCFVFPIESSVAEAQLVTRPYIIRRRREQQLKFANGLSMIAHCRARTAQIEVGRN